MNMATTRQSSQAATRGEESSHPCERPAQNAARLSSEEMPCHMPNFLYNTAIRFASASDFAALFSRPYLHNT
jgi:hypothetical protein